MKGRVNSKKQTMSLGWICLTGLRKGNMKKSSLLVVELLGDNCQTRRVAVNEVEIKLANKVDKLNQKLVSNVQYFVEQLD